MSSCLRQVRAQTFFGVNTGLVILVGMVYSACVLAEEGPGFNCTYAKSLAEKLICTTPELAKLDRQLAELYENTRYQGGIDAKALRKSEDKWLQENRDVCTDVPCIERAYAQRIDLLTEQSMRAASPAAYDETRPFRSAVVPLAQVKAYTGKSCETVRDEAAMRRLGFEKIPGFLPIITAKGTVYPIQLRSDRFAFLTTEALDDSCRLTDVVALPPRSIADSFWQCDLRMPDVTTYPGMAMRLAGHPSIVAYWTIDGQRGQFRREPIGVLGAASTLRCQTPESGE
jgi:uncharacterized protein